MKKRYPPLARKYGTQSVKGLCEHCSEPILDTAKWITRTDGKKIMLHGACWKAILVAERLNPSPDFNFFYAAASCMTFNTEPTEKDIIERFFLNKFTNS